MAAHAGPIEFFKVISNGRFASASDDKTIKIWNSTNANFIRSLTGHNNIVYGLEQLKNGFLASGSADKSIRIWNPDDGTLIKTIMNAHSSAVIVLKLLANGNLASLSSTNDQNIKIWNMTSYSLVRTIASAYLEDVFSAELLSNGLLAVGSNDNFIHIWDTNVSSQVSIFSPFGQDVYSVKQLNNGSLISAGASPKVCISNTNGSNLVCQDITQVANLNGGILVEQKTLYYPANAGLLIEVNLNDFYNYNVYVVGSTAYEGYAIEYLRN